MKVTGLEQLQKNLAKISERYGKAVTDALVTSGAMVQATAKRSIQQKSPGRPVIRYREGGEKINHIAAADGYPPNTDTGNLVRNIFVEARDNQDVYVGTTVIYGKYLELGTLHPKPWLNPALEQNRNRISKLIRDAMKKTTDKGVK